MTIPQTMTYVQADGAGGPEVLAPATGPTPAPRPDEVLIRVAAAGVNRPDVAQRQGSYPPPPGASPILGLEVAGEVVAPQAVQQVAAGQGRRLQPGRDLKNPLGSLSGSSRASRVSKKVDPSHQGHTVLSILNFMLCPIRPEMGRN